MLLTWITISILAGFTNGEIRISLNSGQFPGQWTVRNDSSAAKIQAEVPGGIYSDLNLVQDLFNAKNMEYRDNYRWIGYENWTYETTFQLSQKVLDKTAVNLVFHGIDTIGDVYLNGKLMQSVNNMFVRYVIPIKGVAKEGTNTLQVKLKSSILAAKELAAAYNYEIPPNCTSSIQYGECYINFLRKMQASFSSELSPVVASVGIWKSVEIEAFNTAIVRNVAATIQKGEGKFLVNVVCHFEGATNDHPYLFAIWLNYSAPWTNNRIQEVHDSKSTSNENEATITGYNHFILNTTIQVQEDDKYVWWPHGYGQQPLWNLSCEVRPPLSEPLDEFSFMQVKTGFRTVEVVQDNPLEALKLSIKVNDVPIFARGATWIISHMLPELASDPKTIRKLLQSAKDANMNMLRVWGGGTYESDLFYEIADELGILIWQDMMFASSLYPANEEFLQSVATEIDQQVKRLVSHPCIAVWAGNNDVDEILANNKYNDNPRYVQDYQTLFENTIKPIVKRHDNSRWYATSKTSNGHEIMLDENGHFYPYKSNPWNMTTYEKASYISKYNLQSLPSYKTMSKISKPENLKLNDEFSKLRQHNPKGYQEMMKLINYNLPLPIEGSPGFYELFTYYSQITQAMAKKAEVEKFRIYRSRTPNTIIKYEPYTPAALIWHLNDVWQAPTCSSIEFGGKWKMLHYYAAKFFSPVIIVPELQPNGDLIIFGISDLTYKISGRLSIYLYSWDSMDYLNNQEQRVYLAHSTSTILKTISLPEMWKKLKENNDTFNADSCFFYFRFEDDKKVFNVENFYYPTSFLEIPNLKQAKLKITVKENKLTIDAESAKNKIETEVLIYLDTTDITPFVWLETDAAGSFSDNGFTMIDGTKILKFSNGDERVDVAKLRDTITVRSLSYYYSSSLSYYYNSSIRFTNFLMLILFLLMLTKVFR